MSADTIGTISPLNLGAGIKKGAPSTASANTYALLNYVRHQYSIYIALYGINRIVLCSPHAVHHFAVHDVGRLAILNSGTITNRTCTAAPDSSLPWWAAPRLFDK